MNKLIKLTREDILTKYLDKPILIKCQDTEEAWYIVSDVFSQMPLHMLSTDESDLYDQNSDNINGIQIAGADGVSYLMWIYFECENGWEAYGYE